MWWEESVHCLDYNVHKVNAFMLITNSYRIERFLLLCVMMLFIMRFLIRFVKIFEKQTVFDLQKLIFIMFSVLLNPILMINIFL